MIGTSINNSLTLTGIAAADIAGGAGKAVKYDENGKIVLCNNTGEPMLGILILQTAETVQAGDSVTIQTCGKGKAVAGVTIKAGDMLTVNTDGTFVLAENSNYIAGQAIIDRAASTAASWEAGAIFGIEILKGGQATA